MSWSRLRGIVAPLLLVLVLLVLALLALATRYPEAEVIARAEGWPIVGPLAVKFRARYVPADAATAEAVSPGPGSGAEPREVPEVEIIRVVGEDFLGVKPKVWAPAGTRIHVRPDTASRVILRLQRDFPLSRLSQKGDWYEVRFGNLTTTGMSKGWVLLQDYREPSAEELSAPTPVVPLAATAADGTTIEAAREGLMDGGVEGRCGSYSLWTDVDDAAMLEACERVGSRVDEAYRKRYDIDPVSGAAETVFLFRNTEAYSHFRDRLAPDALELAHAYPGRGYVAVARARRSVAELARSLAHELAHLLNRRSLGPALPPWLDEGIARDFALHAGSLSDAAGRGRRLPTLPGQDRVASLRVLLPLDRAAFQKNAGLNYRAAGLWVEFFLESGGGSLRGRFGDFLRAVARGEPITEELLLEHLDSSWPELESAFTEWELAGFAGR